jgi:hypothetical protein
MLAVGDLLPLLLLGGSPPECVSRPAAAMTRFCFLGSSEGILHELVLRTGTLLRLTRLLQGGSAATGASSESSAW